MIIRWAASYDDNNDTCYALGRRTLAATPEGGTTLYEYGPTGNRITVTDPSGRRIVRTDCYGTESPDIPVKITGFTLLPVEQAV
ncbi:MAG: RHS repeat protein [Desulfobacteraceae bacterium]|nr:RHS repeat protein [Desulfobacteraceae bacterium]